MRTNSIEFSEHSHFKKQNRAQSFHLLEQTLWIYNKGLLYHLLGFTTQSMTASRSSKHPSIIIEWLLSSDIFCSLQKAYSDTTTDTCTCWGIIYYLIKTTYFHHGSSFSVQGRISRRRAENLQGTKVKFQL